MNLKIEFDLYIDIVCVLYKDHFIFKVKKIAKHGNIQGGIKKQIIKYLDTDPVFSFALFLLSPDGKAKFTSWLLSFLLMNIWSDLLA